MNKKHFPASAGLNAIMQINEITDVKLRLIFYNVPKNTGEVVLSIKAF